MQNQVAWPWVLYGAIAVYVIAGVLAALIRCNLSDQIGQGGLSEIGEDRLRGDELADRQRRLAAERVVREREIRQLLQARSARLVSRGQRPLDIDAELARLELLASRDTSPTERALVEEVRQLIIARNERRQRQGLPALDIEVEIERALAELRI